MADIPSTGHVGEAGAHRFPLEGETVGARSSAFVSFALAQVRAGRKVVALYPAWRSADAERAVNFARGALRTDLIAGIGLDLSPLSLSLVADQLAYLAPYLPPGMVAALSGELPKHLLAGAWLRSVSGLATLPTSMRQHVGSYAPSVSFLAFCAPTARVSRMRPAELAAGLPFRPVQPVQLLCSTPDPAITKVFDDNVPPVIQPVATRNLPAQPLGGAYWGTSKYVEFVALSAHPQALAYAAGSLRTSACAWCGEPMVSRPCPFCSANSAGRPTYASADSSARSPEVAAEPPGNATRGPAPDRHPPQGGAPTPGPPPNGEVRRPPTPTAPVEGPPHRHPEPRSYSR
ncbi:hypothetical protein [Nocardiopsis sp. MG754419]|uniref:hypothetical protein n=1 Tax=Nocardiopsis sp. MG754419 TaxID=2259865 RepID=UPI001BA71AA1|nr:hypothetical protein [Nocardiopsis sp. MG754419]MBR8743350.1 hypothetical protein [Nocardiopsis sp. MG754419]